MNLAFGACLTLAIFGFNLFIKGRNVASPPDKPPFPPMALQYTGLAAFGLGFLMVVLYYVRFSWLVSLIPVGLSMCVVGVNLVIESRLRAQPLDPKKLGSNLSAWGRVCLIFAVLGLLALFISIVVAALR